MERKEAEDQGYPEWEVKVNWTLVLVGASDENSAKELAEQIRAQVPTGTEVAVQGTLRDVFGSDPIVSPFAFFLNRLGL